MSDSEGDKLLMRRLVEILLLEGFLRSEGQREDMSETLIESFRAHVRAPFEGLNRRQLGRQCLERLDHPTDFLRRRLGLELEDHDMAIRAHPPSERIESPPSSCLEVGAAPRAALGFTR